MCQVQFFGTTAMTVSAQKAEEKGAKHEAGKFAH